MQEGWGVFQNLPATAARFSEQTGIEVEVTLTVIPEMWELMERSFSGEDPPFDLVGVDDLLLIQAARAGHVEPLDDLIAARRLLARRLHEPGARCGERRRTRLGPAVLRRVERPDLPRRSLRQVRHRRAGDPRRAHDGGRRDPGGGARRRNRRLLRNRDSRRAELRPQLLDGRLDVGPILRRALVRRGRPADARHAGAPRRRRPLRRPGPARGPARVADDGLHGLHGLLQRRAVRR